jgi:hypothetical protein
MEILHAKPIRDIISIKDPAQETEEYIDDIPFNTALIASESLLLKNGLVMAEEVYIDDIPFDTRWIANNSLLAEAVENYRNEAEVHDIPYMTVCIIATAYNDEPAYIVVKKKSQRKSNSKKGNLDDYEYTIFQPCQIEVPTPVPVYNTLTRELLVIPGSSL